MPHRIVHHADLLAVRQLGHPLGDILFVVVDGGPCAGLFRQRGLFVGADATDQARAQRFGPLAGDQPNSAGGGMEQEHLTRLHVVGLAQQVVHRQPFEERSGALLKAEVVRQQRHFSSGTLWTSL